MMLFKRNSGDMERSDLNRRIAINTLLASGERSRVGDRYECCTGSLNVSQRLAALALLRDLRDA